MIKMAEKDREMEGMAAATIWHIETGLNLINTIGDAALIRAVERDLGKGFDIGIVLKKAIEFVKRCERLELP
jgi:hypothetical protein